jgi:hypothetical protein
LIRFYSWKIVGDATLCFVWHIAVATDCDWWRNPPCIMPYSARKSSYSNALNFAKNIQSNDIDVSIYAAMSDTPVLRSENMRNYRKGVISAKPLQDTTISRVNKTQEKVTAILDVLQLETAYLAQNIDNAGVLVSIAFRTGATPFATSTFTNIYDRFDDTDHADMDILLIEKNRWVRSMSTWHDLQIIALRLKPLAIKWLQTLISIYKRHSTGRAFATLEPRPAIREATLRLQLEYKSMRTNNHDSSSRSNDGLIKYFSHDDICVSKGQQKTEALHHTLRYGHMHSVADCARYALSVDSVNHIGKSSTSSNSISSEANKLYHHSQPFITIQCEFIAKSNTIYDTENACAMLHEPLVWKKEINTDIPNNWASNAMVSTNDFDNNMLKTMYFGVVRFRIEDLNENEINDTGTQDKGDNRNSEQVKRFEDMKSAHKESSENDITKTDTKVPLFPRQFCWQQQDNSIVPKLADAKISIGPNQFISYNHTYEYVPANSNHQGLHIHTTDHNENDLQEQKKKEEEENEPAEYRNIWLVTSTSSAATVLDNKKYLSISKMLYCYKHGYKFKQYLSHQYLQYFPPNLWETCERPEAKPSFRKGKAVGFPYSAAVFSKVVIIMQALLDQVEEVVLDDTAATNLEDGNHWIVWTDDDTWINPGWAHLPIYETYLKDVPTDKVYVASNYRSAFTNIIAIRNTFEGRALVYDWVSIVMSGYVECHGYDQAALQVLILSRILNGGHSSTYNTFTPFNHTCRFTDDGDSGCNRKGDWSCDFKFEASLARAGFTSSNNNAYHNGIISSYSKGCANDVIPDFYVVTETKSRPRLQCGLCSRLSEILTSGHWDGPLGGGNDKILPNSINGWLFNHKSEFLFYESYMKKNSCNNDINENMFIPKCDHHQVKNHYGVIYEHGEKEEEKLLQEISKNMTAQRHNYYRSGSRNIISLTDGYAFDIYNGLYCQIDHKSELYKYQQKYTYMKDYYILSKKANENYTTNQWNDRYYHFAGGESRKVCGRDDTHSDISDTELRSDLLAANITNIKYDDYEVDGTLKKCQWGSHAQDRLYEPNRNDYYRFYYHTKSEYCQQCKKKNMNWNIWGAYLGPSVAIDCATVV